GLGAYRQENYFGIFIGHCGLDLIYIGISANSGPFVNITYIHYGLIGNKLQRFYKFGTVFLAYIKGPDRSTGFQALFDLQKDGFLFLGFLISGLGGPLHFFQFLVHRLQILQLQFYVDGLLIPYGVYRTVYMHNVLVIKTAQYM